MKKNKQMNSAQKKLVTLGLASAVILLHPVKAKAEYPTRCTALQISFDLENQEVDVSDVSLHSVITKLRQATRSGTCDFRTAKKDSDEGYVYLTYKTNTAESGYAYDSTRSVYISTSSNMDSLGFHWLNSYSGSANTDINILNRGDIEFKLNKKTPGKTVINLDDITKGFSEVYTSGAAGYTWNMAREYPTIVNNSRSVTLIYRPSCSAKVNDASFGIQTVDAIKKGTVEKEVNIEVSCEDILPHYTLMLNSSRGIADAQKGIIKSDHSNIGYQLNWGQGDGSSVAAAGTAVTLGEVLTASNPEKKDFKLPVKIRPIILDRAQGVVAGNANSDMTVTLEFK